MKLSEMKKNLLPPELEMNVLSRLPVKSLLRFRCVSKEWLRLLTVDTHFINNMHLPRSITVNPNPNPNPSFISLQLYTVDTTHGCCYISDVAGDVKPIYIDYPENKKRLNSYYTFVGICNGLVCVIHKHRLNTVPSKLLVWNPLIRDHITLSYFGPSPSTFKPSRAIFGFGFHQATNQYKLVKLLFSDEEEASPPHISVFTLGTQTWRTLGIVFYNFTCGDFPLTIDGSPHWLIHRSGTKHDLVVAFDVKDEVLQEIPLPVQAENGQCCPIINVLGGLLCMIIKTLQKEIEIWVMKEYGVPSSWTKQFKIRETEIFKIDWRKPLGITCNREIIFWSRDNRGMELLLYNPKTNSFKGPTKFKFGLDEVFTFAGSLVSPKFINGGASQITLTEEDEVNVHI